MELIFETFEDPMTLSKIKIPNLCYNGALYVGIDIRRMQFFKNIIFKMHKINEADFQKFLHLKISSYTVT